MSKFEPLYKSEDFLSASREELRALVVLLDKGKITADELAESASISSARAKSALLLWEEVGIFGMRTESRIEDIYPERQNHVGVVDEDRRTVAKTIQSEELAALLEECAKLLHKPTLNDVEVKIITGLYSQYSLSEEYILTLLSDITARSTKPTIKKLELEAIRRLEDGIDTTEALTEFFHHRDNMTKADRVVRYALSLSRSLSPSEKKLAERWVCEFCYGEDMILLAYDFATASTTTPTLKYLDPILTEWHENGVSTPVAAKEFRAHQKGEKAQKSEPKKSKKEPVRYGNFDPEEAFRRALERSFSDESEGK